MYLCVTPLVVPSSLLLSPGPGQRIVFHLAAVFPAPPSHPWLSEYVHDFVFLLFFFIWSLFRYVCCNLSISRLFTRPVLVCVLCCCSNSPRQSRQQKRGSLGKRTSIPPIVLLKCLNGRPLSGNYTPSPHFTCLVLFCFFAQHTL